MILKKNSILSFTLSLAVILSVVTLGVARDEGMYMPDRIASLDLKKRGLKIKPEEIYNPNGGGLTDAVIRLSIGCTAEFVSPEGLILTNHHCAFDALVTASQPGTDLVETGFRTDNRSGEISAKGYSIYITQRSEDVTAKIRKGTESLSGEALAAAIKKNIDELTTAEQRRHAGSVIESDDEHDTFIIISSSADKGVGWCMRAENIGVFGGDPDILNGHVSGDFIFSCLYAPDGSSRNISDNIPDSRRILIDEYRRMKDNEFVLCSDPGGTTVIVNRSRSNTHAMPTSRSCLHGLMHAAEHSA